MLCPEACARGGLLNPFVFEALVEASPGSVVAVTKETPMLFRPSLQALAVATALGALAGTAQAQFKSCPQFFPGAAPVIKGTPPGQLRELCFSAFAVLHSGERKTPVFVVERLTREQLVDAEDERRGNRFYAEARLPSADRAQLEDYEHSGYDRGHMAPAGDMPTAEAMAQSFSLANMVPQAPRNNQQSWRRIETDTRAFVKNRAAGSVFVFTGPVYGARPKKIGDGKVWVPKYLYKLVYDQQANRAWAHWTENTDEAKPGAPISYAELVERTGIQFLPASVRLKD